ncbi:MAG: sigma 54-interacting transcriptional regulator [Candidatus Eisenbacteria bacterium]|nr:sigma 54-interacting transcriptional regulator [Candidatus Eisenbacteria bacterium]
MIPTEPPASGGAQRGADVDTLVEVARALTAIRDFDHLLEVILDTAIRELSAEMGILVLLNEVGEPINRTARNFAEESLPEDQVQVSRKVLRNVVESGTSACITDALSDPNWISESVQGLSLRSILCVPLVLRTGVGGALYLENRRVAGIFGPREQRYLEAIASLAAIGLDNAHLYAELENRREALQDENARLKIALGKPEHFEGFIGTSPAMQKILHLLRRVADSKVNVLIRGESGTGKGMVARRIHELSPRKNGPYIEVNCAAVPETLLESEFFGVAKGTATGVDARVGRFEQASGGTIFLDEIGDMSLTLQAKILKAVQEHVVERVGGREPTKVDVRIVAATNKNLEESVAAGSFREDLFFRLNVVPLVLPPLRDRMSDVPSLAEFFLKRYATENNRDARSFTRAAIDLMMTHHWPGNVRELENAVAQAVVLSEGVKIETHDLPPSLRDAGKRTGGARTLDDAAAGAEKELILAALEEHAWSRQTAARALGVSRVTLYKKMKRYGIEADD